MALKHRHAHVEIVRREVGITHRHLERLVAEGWVVGGAGQWRQAPRTPVQRRREAAQAPASTFSQPERFSVDAEHSSDPSPPKPVSLPSRPAT